MDKKYYVENNSSFILEVENDQSFFFEDNKTFSFKAMKIDALVIKKNVNYKSINNINIQRIHQKTFKVLGGPKVYQIATDVMFDVETNKKILTISSPLVIKNNTQKIIDIRYVDKSGESNLVIHPSETIPVPFDLLEEMSQIKFNDSNEWSIYIYFSEFLEKNLTKAILMGEKFINISSTFENSYKKTINFDPPFVLKNCLPISLQITLTYKAQEKTKSGGNNIDQLFLEPQESYDIYDVPFDSPISSQILIQGFKLSSLKEINPQKFQEIIDFKIFDEKGAQQTISLKCVLTNNGGRMLFFFCKSFIVNETYFDLWFFTINNENKKQPIPGQKLSKEWKNMKMNDKIVLLHEEKNLVVCDQNNMNELSQQIRLDVLTGTLIEFYTSKGFVQMATKVNMLCVGILLYI